MWAVLATGPSMSQAVADRVRDRCSVVAVSDSYRLAPWADALAATDAAWWRAHPKALQFEGRRFGILQSFQNVHGVESLNIDTSTNSGLLAVMVAVKLGAKRVLLCGLDMHSPGDHFFGKHPAPLKPTRPERMEIFKRQFAAYRPRGVEIINCTPGSALQCYPKADLEACLSEFAALVG